MAKTNFKFEGGRELEAALKKLPRATAKNVTRRVLKKEGQPIAEDARDNAPTLSGRLRDDVTVGTRLNRRQAAMARRLGKAQVEVHIGVNDPAGVQNEFGNEHQAPQPFFRKAWDSNSANVLRGIASGLWTEIEKSAKRLARKAARGR